MTRTNTNIYEKFTKMYKMEKYSKRIFKAKYEISKSEFI